MIITGHSSSPTNDIHQTADLARKFRMPHLWTGPTCKSGRTEELFRRASRSRCGRGSLHHLADHPALFRILAAIAALAGAATADSIPR
ncbi:MAG TPA: hypothetical protein VFV01_24000 [Spirillospora sp.]|nr:hypothetical protein [Spirillospora sp.]